VQHYLNVGFLMIIIALISWHIYQKHLWQVEKDKQKGRGDVVREDLLAHLPLGVALIDSEGIVSWHNEVFGSSILGKGRTVKGKVTQYLPDLSLGAGDLEKKGKAVQVALKGRVYRAEIHELKKNREVFLLTLEDITDRISLDQCRQEERPVIAFIQIDNFSETVLEVDDEKRPVLLAEIDRILTEWAMKMEGYLRKFSEDKYLLLINQAALRESQKNRFEIMDRIREIALGNKIPVTLSMGIGAGEETIVDLARLAHLGMDLALGRGGDQVVLKWQDRVLFYGGRTTAVEKKTKVRTRVVAFTLKRHMEQAANVVVMGHESSDLDSAGSSLGIARIAMNFNKQVHVVMDNSTGALDRLLEAVKVYPEFGPLIISKKEVLPHVNKNTLLVICDTHKPSLLIEPEALQKANKIVLIDHHRRAEEFIKEAQLIYVESYASSTCELVTEIIQYLSEEVLLDSFVASALLAGIIVDTKNFVFQTGVRTFEAASFLRRSGAETGLVRKLLQDDYFSVLERAQIIQNSEILFGHIAVGILDRVVPHNTVIAAQAADILLNIENISASFVLYASGDGVNISGRSNGEMNVQVILEQLGGGGNLSMAGAQLKGVSVPEAKDKLKTVLQAYLDEK